MCLKVQYYSVHFFGDHMSLNFQPGEH